MVKNWMTDAYPNAVQILDFYHVLEYLHEFSAAHFKDPPKARSWVEQHQQLLLESEVEQVLQHIKRLNTSEKQDISHRRPKGTTVSDQK